MKRRRWLCALALVLVMVAAACGDDDDEAAETGSGSETEETAASEEIPVVAIAATDDVAAKRFTFEVPAEIPGGVVTIQLDNQGEEPHDLQLVEATDGHTLDELIQQATSEEEPLSDWVVGGGGPHADPGETGSATLDLGSGKWFYFCTESSGGEEEGSESVPHARNGMAGEFTVGEDSGAELPETEASITAKDYSFETSGLKPGKNRLTFANAGPQQIHHALLFPVAEGKTFAEAREFLMSDAEPTGPPPVDFEGGVGSTVISPDLAQVIEFDLKPGTYALICFMPDKGTAGPPHAAKGMLTEVTIS